MQKTKDKLFKVLLPLLLAIVMLAAMTTTLASCGNSNDENPNPDATNDAHSGTLTGGESTDEDAVSVTLIVKNKAGLETFYDVIAKEGDNLLSAMLQSGILKEEGIKDGMVLIINGETADYSVDQSYWAFTKDSEYMMTGAEDTILEDGAVYQFTYTVMTEE